MDSQAWIIGISPNSNMDCEKVPRIAYHSHKGSDTRREPEIMSPIPATY